MHLFMVPKASALIRRREAGNFTQCGKSACIFTERELEHLQQQPARRHCLEVTMATKLTRTETAIVDRFEQLLRSRVVGPVEVVSVTVRKGGFNAAAHDKHEAFISKFGLGTLAACIENALDQVHAQNPSEEERKARRIADLKEQLARLEAPTEQPRMLPSSENGEDGVCLHCGRDNSGHDGEPCSDDCPQYEALTEQVAA